eukprot:Hpha_TRINITY_DN15170_c3_g3::TRINITY_DN15170_c3_g3_i2::g.129061::m.129061
MSENSGGCGAQAEGSHPRGGGHVHLAEVGLAARELNDVEPRHSLGLVGREGRGADHLVTLLPPHGGGKAELAGVAEGLEHTKDLIEVAPRRGGVQNGKLQLQVGADKVQSTRGEGHPRSVLLVGVEHAEAHHHLALLVSDDWKGQGVGAVSRVSRNVLGPRVVALHGVARHSDHLPPQGRKLLGQTCAGAELGGADGGEVLRVREEDGPRAVSVLHPTMQRLDRALAGLQVRELGEARAHPRRPRPRTKHSLHLVHHTLGCRLHPSQEALRLLRLRLLLRPLLSFPLSFLCPLPRLLLSFLCPFLRLLLCPLLRLLRRRLLCSQLRGGLSRHLTAGSCCLVLHLLLRRLRVGLRTAVAHLFCFPNRRPNKMTRNQ